ncbi:putative dimethylaniline monooxygenase [Paraphoma chrysanthemicola]|nr:putative dimethylaniline monooxygenase [Paraphoma chrysanthemicola]
MAPQKEVIIIGGGISGLGMAVQLKRLLGHNNFTIYEKSDNVGGTWWHNRYPACACDIPSHFYSYSFALKPDWSSMYPGRDELHAYFLSVAEKYNIVSHCRFNAMCKSMVWDNARQLWTCTFEDTVTGDTFVREAPVVVSAIGTLDRPNVPDIEGAADFQGKIFHSARWDHSVVVKNKNVVVLGNGASATQFVPELVREVAPRGKVTQLVKSAHWWTKRGNPVYSGLWKSTMRYVPFAARMYRVYLAWQLESTFYSFYMTQNGLRLRNKTREATRQYVENDAPKQYRDILMPDYEPGCKRRVNTQTYLACLHSPNMYLAKDRVIKISKNHVETETGATYPADVIVYATGFATQKWLFPMEIKGIGGQDMHNMWDAAGGAEAYKGTVVTGFPNLFVLYGPNAATGQHSVIFHSECQINYSCRLLRPVLCGRDPADSIAVKPEAQARDLSWVHSKLKHLVFNSGCQSWWMDPKTKKNTFIYPDPMFKYWLRTIFPTWSDFNIKKQGRLQDQSSTGKLLVGAIVGLGVALLTVSSVSDWEKPLALLQQWQRHALINFDKLT